MGVGMGMGYLVMGRLLRGFESLRGWIGLVWEWEYWSWKEGFLILGCMDKLDVIALCTHLWV